MIDFNKPSEGIDYVIVPFDTEEVSGWVADIISGPFKGQRILYNQIAINGVDGKINYRMLHSNMESPDGKMDHSEFDAFGEFAHQVLVDIIKNGIANGSIVLDDKDSSN